MPTNRLKMVTDGEFSNSKPARVNRVDEDERRKLKLPSVFSSRKCNTTASNLGKILRGAYGSRASFADDYLASIQSL